MRIVPFDFKVFETVIEQRCRFAFDQKRWQGTRFTGQLQLGLFHMVAVQVGIAAGPDEITHFQIALLRHHMH
ncbi:hypothetical protein D3C72_1308560 [compost metagenome]